MNIILFTDFPQQGTLELPLTDPRCKHILKVLRLGVGDAFSMGIVNGPSGRAVIEAVDDKAMYISWNPELPPVPLYPVTLLTAQVRPICMKRILREAVCLGVKRILVTGADTAEKSYQEANIWKNGDYMKHIFDGAQQAASTGIPEVELFPSVQKCLRNLEEHALPGQRNFVFDNRDFAYSIEGITGLANDTEVVLAIGPERGWSDRERELFTQAGFEPLRMGERILRTETACAVGTALILNKMGLLY